MIKDATCGTGDVAWKETTQNAVGRQTRRRRTFNFLLLPSRPNGVHPGRAWGMDPGVYYFVVELPPPLLYYSNCNRCRWSCHKQYKTGEDRFFNIIKCHIV